MRDYKQEIEALKDAEPWTSVCLTRRDIYEIGGGSFEKIRKDLALNFPHAWLPDHQSDNVYIVRLQETNFEETQSYREFVREWFANPKKKPSIMDITRGMYGG